MSAAALRLQAAIIDLDGTLVDTAEDFSQALNAMLQVLIRQGDLRAKSSVRLETAQVRSMVGKGSEHLVHSALKCVFSAGASSTHALDALAALAMPVYQDCYRDINGRHAEIYAGVLEGLERLQSLGLELTCLTNKPVGFAEPLLAEMGLAPFFTHVFGGDSFERKKPDPLPVLKCCEAMGTLPGRTLVIGDSSNDAKAARSAGCPVVLVTYGYNHGEPILEVDADAFVESLLDVPLV
ncbi:MAG: HAD-IA family hydrolase [Pseudomonadota bacterium]